MCRGEFTSYPPQSLIAIENRSRPVGQRLRVGLLRRDFVFAELSTPNNQPLSLVKQPENNPAGLNPAVQQQSAGATTRWSGWSAAAATNGSGDRLILA